VKDFQGPSNWGGRTSSSTTGLENYMCGTGPLSEEYVLKKSNAKKEMLYAYEALRGINNIQSAIKAVKVGGDEVQPPCMDALDNCKLFENMIKVLYHNFVIFDTFSCIHIISKIFNVLLILRTLTKLKW